MTKYNESPLAQPIKQLRRAYRDTQLRFAARLGVSVCTLRCWETWRPPAPDGMATLRRLAEVIGYDPAAFR